MKRHVFAAAFGALLVVLPVREALRADAALYTVEDLGTIEGFAPTVTGINASGQVSGYVTGASGMPRAVRYTDGSGWEYIPGISTLFSLATGISDSGDIVGYHFSGAGFRAFHYADGAGASFIDPLPGDNMSVGLGINANGDIVGQSSGPGAPRAFRAAPGLPAVPLSLLGGTNATACGINAAGQITGFSTNAAGQQHAYRLEADSSVTDIVPFDGPGGTGWACAIDAAGRVGGRATSGSAFRAFTFTAGAAANVDTFATSQQSTIESIAAGVAVGWFLTLAEGSAHAFVNSENGSSDLNDLIAPGTGWTLEQAFAINVNGTIVGLGKLDGTPRAFRLTRVGEAEDTTAPVITALSATPASIEPPNNAMVDVVISASATDDRDPSPVCSVTGIDGHGAPATDFSVVGPLAGWVRARGGATYSFAVSCRDAAGNAASGSVDVVVPPDTTAPIISSVSADPSTIWPPNGALVPVTVAVSATDNVDAAPSCALTSVSGISLSSDDYAITGPLSAKLRALGGRTYTLNVKCSDTAGNQSSAAVAVFVPPDTTAPVISEVVATPGAIWPPNGKMVAVSVGVTAGDDVDEAPQCALKAVVSNGGAAEDAAVTGPFSASVRAERNADGSTRTYTLKVACRDAAGNTSWGSATVAVSKDGPSPKAAYKGLLVRALKAKAQLTKKILKAYFSRGSSR